MLLFIVSEGFAMIDLLLLCRVFEPFDEMFHVKNTSVSTFLSSCFANWYSYTYIIPLYCHDSEFTSKEAVREAICTPPVDIILFVFISLDELVVDTDTAFHFACPRGFFYHFITVRVVLYKITYCGCCLGLSSGHQLIQQHCIHTVSSAYRWQVFQLWFKNYTWSRSNPRRFSSCTRQNRSNRYLKFFWCPRFFTFRFTFFLINVEFFKVQL